MATPEALKEAPREVAASQGSAPRKPGLSWVRRLRRDRALLLMTVPAGVLLLVFITGTGIALGTSAGKPRRDAPPERMIPMPTSHR